MAKTEKLGSHRLELGKMAAGARVTGYKRAESLVWGQEVGERHPSESRHTPTQVESGFPPGIISHCLPSFSARPCFSTQWSSDILNGANNGMAKTL